MYLFEFVKNQNSTNLVGQTDVLIIKLYSTERAGFIYIIHMYYLIYTMFYLKVELTNNYPFNKL